MEKVKQVVAIPVIASLNCITPGWWTDYAKKIEAAGADAIELNVAVLPSDPRHSGRDIEQLYYRIVGDVKKNVKIPML